MIRRLLICLATLMLFGMAVVLAIGVLGLPQTWRMGILVLIVLAGRDMVDKFGEWAKRRWP